MAKKKSVSRRGFLKMAAAGTCGSLVHGVPFGGSFDLVKSAQAITGGAFTNLVVIGLDGGANTFNMAPTVGGQHQDNNPTTSPDPEATNALYLNGNQMLHPEMTNIFRLIMSGEGLMINEVGYPGHSRSHGTAQRAWKTGDVYARMESDGWLNQLGCLSTSQYATVSVAGQATIISGACPNARAMNSIDSLTQDRYRNSTGRTEAIRAAGTQFDLMSGLSGNDKESFISNSRIRAIQASETLETYRNQPLVDENGNNVNFPGNLGNRLEDIARFIIAQPVLQTIASYASIGGWDTHGNEAGRMNNLLSNVDSSIRAFERVLKGAGAWDNTLIVIATEFGRTCVENDGLGNDHGKSWKAFLLGGCLRQGGVLGAPPTEAQLNPSNLQGRRVLGDYNVDYRNLFDQILYGLMGRDVGLFEGNYDRSALNLFR